MSADYQCAASRLNNTALAQASKHIINRDKVNLHHHYSVYWHTTYVWVRKQEWDALPPTQRLNPDRYFDTRTEAHGDYRYAIPVPGAPIKLRLYRTDIATLYANGDIELAAGGWERPTTRKWIDMVKPHDVYVGNTKPNQWTPCCWVVRNHAQISRFYDGIRLNAEGVIISGIKPVPRRVPDRKKCKEFIDAARHFRKLYAPIVAMLEGGVPAEIREQLPRNRWEVPLSTEFVINLIMSRPTEADHVLAYRASFAKRWWYPRDGNQDNFNNFNNTIKRGYTEWIKRHALVNA